MDDVFLPPPAAKVTPGGILLPLALIDAGDRIRQVNAAAVALLADSIAKNGLISPLLVRPTPDDRYRLVIGGHRLAALGLLAATEVRCEIKDLDDDEALSIELDENLSRHELDQIDFGLFCMERKALDERLDLRNGRGGDRKSSARKSNGQVGHLITRFTADLAERIGRGERTVRRAIEIAEDLDREAVALLRNSKFADNQQALRVISQMPKARQRGAVQDLLDGRFKTAAAARDAYEGKSAEAEDPQMRYLAQLHAAWGLANDGTRAVFLSDIDAAFVGTSSVVKTAPAKPAPAKPAKGRGR